MTNKELEHGGWTADCRNGITTVYDGDSNAIMKFYREFTKGELETCFKAFHEGFLRGQRLGVAMKQREIRTALGLPPEPEAE